MIELCVSEIPLPKILATIFIVISIMQRSVSHYKGLNVKYYERAAHKNLS